MNDFRRGDGVEGSWIHSVAHHPLESPSGLDFRQRRVECGRRYGCKGEGQGEEDPEVGKVARRADTERCRDGF